MPSSFDRVFINFITALGLLCLSACSEANGGVAPSGETLITVASTATPQPTLAAPDLTPEATPLGEITLSVWWPEPLAPVNQDTVQALLSQQISDFEAAQSDVHVALRLKKSDGVGGILETLQAANRVAPGSLPDVTLMRREDLLNATQSELLQPLNETAFSLTLNDLYPGALGLGQIGSELYGLAYALTIEHIAYRPVQLVGSFAHFADVLKDRQTFVFPAGDAGLVTDMLFLQYRSAGGTVAQISSGGLDETALREVFSFYQQAVTEGLIDPALVTAILPDDYAHALEESRIDAAVVTSAEYLDWVARGQSLEAAPIPLAEGKPATILDGWMWVMVAKDEARQAMAVRFVEWMLQPERQAAYTRLVNQLASRRAAMQSWEDTAYRAFAEELLLNAAIPPDVRWTALRAIQNGLTSVISGQRSVDEAVQDVLQQVGS